jgi:hypothetical protein
MKQPASKDHLTRLRLKNSSWRRHHLELSAHGQRRLQETAARQKLSNRSAYSVQVFLTTRAP